MRFSEIFLRLGASLVGWMVLIAYLMWLAVTRKLDCATSGDELFLLLLYTGPPAALMSLMIQATRPMREIQAILRWLIVVPALLLVPVLLALFEIATGIYLDGDALCAAGTPPTWQLVLPVVAALSVIVILFTCVRVFLTSGDKPGDIA